MEKKPLLTGLMVISGEKKEPLFIGLMVVNGKKKAVVYWVNGG